MPSTYTTRNRAEKQATGENLNVWGTNLNTRTTDLFDESMDGVETVSIASAATLDLSSATYTKNGESDTSRQRILIFTDTHASGTAITVPSVEKWYFIRNSGSTAITLAPSGGTTASVAAGADAIVFSNGTNCYLFRARLNELASPNGSVAMNSQKITGLLAGTAGTDAVNKTQLDATAELAEDWATKTDGFVSGSDNSAKSWAQGGTGDGQPTAGDAKSWATSTSIVAGGLKGARGYATDASTSAAAAATAETNAETAETNAETAANLAETWATSLTEVTGGFLGARGYAEAADDTYDDFLARWFVSATEPPSPIAGYVWFDTAGGVLKVRNAANTAWSAVTIPNVASETAAGIVELATASEMATATDTARVSAVANLYAYTKYRPGNVIKADKTDTFSTTSTSFVDVTGLSVTITPVSASSRILVFAQMIGASSDSTGLVFFKLLRGSTDVLRGDAAGSRTRAHAALFAQSPVNATLVAIDSPATTSATIYKVQCAVSSGTGHVNRSASDADAAATGRYASSLVVMEIV